MTFSSKKAILSTSLNLQIYMYIVSYMGGWQYKPLPSDFDGLHRPHPS